ncbi:MAG TPA: hypothetical protein VII66_02785 [Gemmatimonadaceae bacterium]
MFKSVQIPNSHPGYEFGVRFGADEAVIATSDHYGLVAMTDGPNPFVPGQLMVTARAWQVKPNGQALVVDGKRVEAPQIQRAFTREDYDAPKLATLFGDAAAELEKVLIALPVEAAPVATP